MGSVARLSLIEQNITADLTSDPQTIGQGDARFHAFWSVSNRVGGTFNCSIEHSPDGSNWFTLATFAALAVDGAEAIDITTDSVFPRIRAVLTGGAGPNADVRVDLYYDKHR